VRFQIGLFEFLLGTDCMYTCLFRSIKPGPSSLRRLGELQPAWHLSGQPLQALRSHAAPSHVRHACSIRPRLLIWLRVPCSVEHASRTDGPQQDPAWRPQSEAGAGSPRHPTAWDDCLANRRRGGGIPTSELSPIVAPGSDSHFLRRVARFGRACLECATAPMLQTPHVMRAQVRRCL